MSSLSFTKIWYREHIIILLFSEGCENNLYVGWKLNGATVTITYNTSYISKVTVNGLQINSGWSGTIKQGDVIKAYGSYDIDDWYYDGDGRFGGGTTVTCNAPLSSGSGTLYFRYGGYDHDGDYPNVNDSYFVKRGGACASWTFSAS